MKLIDFVFNLQKPARIVFEKKHFMKLIDFVFNLQKPARIVLEKTFYESD